MSDKQNLLLLFERPQEPVFIAKGDKRAAFDVPNSYLPDKYKPIGVELSNRFGEDANERIPVREISVPPLGEIMDLGRNENFSLFIPKHRRIAGRLIDIFLGVRNAQDLLSVAVYARDRVNPYLFNYALSVALLHRPDTQDLDVPSFIQSFPDKFVDSKVFAKAREEANIVPEGSRAPIEIPKDYTASDLEEEHRLAYFREDLGINLHHWHWHLVYPFEAALEVVNKNRRGELFYYMHQQIIARQIPTEKGAEAELNFELRVLPKVELADLYFPKNILNAALCRDDFQKATKKYNCERLSNKLKRVTRFIDWRQPIEEAYFPKLDSLVASRSWPARVANQKLKDLNREVDQIKQDVDDLYRWRDRIFAAIHSGMVTNMPTGTTCMSKILQRLLRRQKLAFGDTEQGASITLTENEGIDILGNMIESSILSPNRTLYGDMHNMGHVLISYIHDPDHRHLESFGVMGDSATAMRDPVFYRWHSYIDDIFQEYKATLPRYQEAQLNYPGVTVSKIEVTSQGGRPNTLSTFWQQSDVDMSRGMDFQPRGTVFVRFTHLQHTPFNYKLTVNNQGGSKMGTCRIFLAPKVDERGNPWLFRDQKNMFIELDKFTVSLKQGQNTITRASTQSSVTIPFERTFRNLDLNRPQGGDELAQFNFCGCGWPQHMLIPKGSPEGLSCQLFVMISNYENDRIQQTIEGQCNDAGSYCGIKDKLYPDRRSMGYPFDRMPRTGVDTLQQFLTPNMRVQDVTIKFSNRTVKPRERN